MAKLERQRDQLYVEIKPKRSVKKDYEETSSDEEVPRATIEVVSSSRPQCSTSMHVDDLEELQKYLPLAASLEQAYI